MPARVAPEAAAGRVTENVEPLPGALTTSMVPPCSSTSRLEMASPRPVPWYFLTRVLSPWTKGWNSRAMSASSMPGPWSRTQKRTAEPASSAPISTAVWSSLNFTALESRFSRIWRSLPRSARTPEDDTARVRTSIPFRWACGATRDTASVIAPAGASGSTCSSIRPDSIFARSRMSLIKASKCLPLASTSWTNLTCSGESDSWPSSRRSSEKPMIAFSGVRSSCDMLARNSLFWRLAVSSCTVFSATLRSRPVV